jgi:DNA-binding response OmpR family regulator
MRAPNETTLMVVEDEYLVATSIEMVLQGAGYAVVGPIPSLAEALEAVAGQPADLALLDVNLAGHRVYPVADALSSRQVPFIFLTGCEGAELPSRFADTPILVKPFAAGALLHAIGLALGHEMADGAARDGRRTVVPSL